MDSSAVYTLFEELKQKIDELGKKTIPDNQAESTSDPQEQISLIKDLQIRINQQQFTPEQIKNLGQISAYSVNKVSEHLNKVITEIKASINPIDEKITLLKFPQNMVTHNDHNFGVDSQNSKAAITMISMALIILFSFGGNIWQLNSNQLKDNDLKYRYIKSTNWINPENLYKLEDIFQYNWDKKLIKEIRGNVEENERKLIEIARKLNATKVKMSKIKGKINRICNNLFSSMVGFELQCALYSSSISAVPI